MPRHRRHGKTTILGGMFDVGDSGIRAFGLLLLVVAGAFLVASAAALPPPDRAAAAGA